MLAVTSDKALLRAVWEVVERNANGATIDLSDAVEHLRSHGAGFADENTVVADARLLEELGLLRVSATVTPRVELTHVGAFLATRLSL